MTYHETVDNLTERLVKKLRETMGDSGRTAVCSEANRLIARSAECQALPLVGRERVFDQAIQSFFGEKS